MNFKRIEDFGNVSYLKYNPKNYDIGTFCLIKKEKDYLYSAIYGDLDYENAFNYYKQSGDFSIGACSSVRNGDFLGRNFDWIYSNQATFIIQTPRTDNRYGSYGISSGFPALTNDFVESGEDSNYYKLVPFQMVDGKNEYGVVASMNVVPTDKGENVAYASVKEKETIYSLMLIRYILDKFQTAKEAVEYIRDYVTVVFSKQLHKMHYETHILVADGTDTYVIEFAYNKTVILEKDYITNFHLYETTLNSDGTVYTPETQDATHNAIVTNNITKNGSGLERFNYIVDNYATANTKQGMRDLLNGLTYTKTYITSDDPSDPFWYTEYVGGENTVASSVEDFESVVEYYGSVFENRSRDSVDPITWQTVHSSIYDLDNDKLYLTVQEDGEELEISPISFDYKKL